MAAPSTTVPCAPWTTDEEVRACCRGLALNFDLTPIINFTSAVLYRLSGRQWPGPCERIVWPCRGENTGCADTAWGTATWGYPSTPMRVGNGWINCGACCGGCNLSRVKLAGPINEIIEVIVDGEILPSEAYKIEAYRWLVRVDGGRWPCSNNLAGEPGDPGTWTVEYSYGKPVPDDGRYVAAIYACEMAKARCGADNCLPARVKHISRQDVDIAFADPMDFIEDGKVGIYEVDQWLQSVNPHKIQRRGRVYRPDARVKNTTFT
jgi:hypothetical protein